jgi:hypothetical protein
MLVNNSGFQKLMGIIDHVRSTGQDMAVFEHWRQRRWSEVMDNLERLNKQPQVGDFIDTYAASLADSIFNLLVAGALSEAAEAPVDFVENLLSQSEDFAESVRVAPTPAPIADPPIPGIDVPHDWALAA